ncbi:MAG: insulinase family protein [Oscillospiraceae bacterium]|nr:insulinase family protein [Oscillospiraceae bacterium]
MKQRNQEVITSPKGEQSCLHVKHETGLDIYIMEMPDYHSSYALFGTKYGSVNTMFRLDGEADYAQVPEGIAHFLEHKLFENEDTGAFEQYAKTGAIANAYTSFDRTAYLFMCSENFNPSLEILLNFVQHPYFTQETVDKEQGIIAQEIRMNEDEPGWKLFFNSLKCMYQKHPVRIGIAGTVESIQEIDADLLYRCYHTFYNLHNMTLSIAGNVKAEEILEICDRLLLPSEDHKLEEVYPDEPYEVYQHEVIDTAPVGVPLFSLDFKLRPKSGETLLRAEMLAELTMDTLFNSSTEIYQQMLEENLINFGFGVDAPFTGNGYFSVGIGGESRNPREVRKRVFEVIRNAKDNGFDKQAFERLRKAKYGNMIRSMNSVESNASMMLDCYMCGIRPFTPVSVLSEITYEEALQFLRDEIDTENTVLSVVHAQGDEIL